MDPCDQAAWSDWVAGVWLTRLQRADSPGSLGSRFCVVWLLGQNGFLCVTHQAQGGFFPGSLGSRFCVLRLLGQNWLGMIWPTRLKEGQWLTRLKAHDSWRAQTHLPLHTCHGTQSMKFNMFLVSGRMHVLAHQAQGGVVA